MTSSPLPKICDCRFTSLVSDPLSMDRTDSFELHFLPWAGLETKTRIGSVEIWPWSNSTARSVRDPNLKGHLKRLFRRFVDNCGNQVDSIAICSHSKRDFRELNESERREVRRAADALTFAVLAPGFREGVVSNNRTLAPPRADRFELFSFRVVPGDEYISVCEGSLTQVWPLDKVLFSRPWSMGGSFGSENEALIAALGRLLTKGPDDVCRRVFLALEWFRLAHTERANVSERSRVVMLATALETILEVPKDNKRTVFCSRCEALFGALPLKIKTSQVKSPPQKFSLARWWAFDFYELRNAILHGDEDPLKMLRDPVPGLSWVSHLIVADLMLLLAVERALIEKKLHGAEIRQEIEVGFAKEVNCDAEELNICVAIWLGSYRVFESLGWIVKLTATGCADGRSIVPD